MLISISIHGQQCSNFQTTYDIDQCLQKKQKNSDAHLQQQMNNKAFTELKHIRNQLCRQLSKPYADGSYGSIKYGYCVISFNQWYQNQREH